MIQEALEQIEHINKGLRWIKRNHPEHYEQRFLQLVEERRKLRILIHAELNNPGVAAFGQSQVGKSYLMNSILQDNGSPFMVESPLGEQNFVDQINPIGGGQEATGVVTRFSSYKRNPDDYNKELPIRFCALSVRDMIMIICDTYFKDFDDYTMDSELEIIDMLQNLCSKYASYEELSNPVLTADDILEMKLYFKRHINNGQIYSVRTAFFDRLATIIDKVPISDYASIFSTLWHYENEFTKLFNRGIAILQRIKFAEYVYLPISAVVHGGVKEDTVMSVSCLQLLYDDRAGNYTTDVYLKNGNSMEKLGRFTKSEMCTICSEVVIKISDKYLTSTGEYDTRNIPLQTQAKLPSGEVTMSLLQNTDLLDFPGARARENGKLENIQNKETLMYSFLRGKVAYLFNKYNEEKNINILLYCHHQKNNDATDMWQLLDRWVSEYVGDTPEKRAAFLKQTEVSPLFHVGTMFNVDLQNSDNGTVGNTAKSISDRWKSRFYDLLLLKCFHKQDVQWVSNWDGTGCPFRNSYMLRDFKFSKQVYSGFETEGKETGMIIEQSYYNDMRRLFIESNETHHLFQDAELSWDTSASVGNDGSLYIIQQLSKVASKIFDARDAQIAGAFRDVCNNCYNILKEYYISTDVEEILDINIQKAHSIFREMEFTCQSRPEYFGHMLQSLQLSETECFKELHSLIPTLAATVNDSKIIQDYELIRKRCNNFEGCTSETEMWNVLLAAYRFSNQEDAISYLKKKGIDPQKLFRDEVLQRKNSAVISHKLVSLWQKKISSAQFMNAYTGDKLVDEIVMGYLVTCVVSTAQGVKLRERIEEKIADYVDVLNASSINEDLIADMIATTISDFVIDWGYRHLNEEQIKKSRRVASERNLPCFDWIERDRKEYYTEEEMTHLFNAILSSVGRYTPAYDANYNIWLEYMYIAFIAHVDVPDYDRMANDELKAILDEMKI